MSAPRHTPDRDPSSSANQFADRLTDAIAARGLSLQRIQTHLASSGLKVSTATLSYWSTGRSRPTRGRSYEVVRTLERILQVAPGHLVDVLPAERTLKDIDELMPPSIPLPEDIAKRHHEQARSWHRLLTHDTSIVRADRTERLSRGRMVSRAEVDGLDSWLVMVRSEHGQTASIVPGPGMAIRSTRVLPEHGLYVAELQLPRPLRRGETVQAGYECHFGPGTEALTRVLRALPTLTDLLLLEAHFEGPAPHDPHRVFVDPRTGSNSSSTHSLHTTSSTVQCVVPNAVPGTHALTWRW